MYKQWECKGGKKREEDMKGKDNRMERGEYKQKRGILYGQKSMKERVWREQEEWGGYRRTR